MQDTMRILRREERVTLALRSLYEQMGYRKFRMNRFEEYDFYAGYRDFLVNGQIIAFTDLDGKLMALRPDVTLSIAKKAGQGSRAVERMYYTEPVYRPARSGQQYRESDQVGIEYIGDVTPYAALEVMQLAAQSLGRIAPEYVLDISHTGYLRGLLDGAALTPALRGQVQRCREEQNAHGLQAVLQDVLAEAEIARFAEIARLSGSFAQTLEKARALACGPAMLEAVDVLSSLYDAYAKTGDASMLRLDFGITSDAKYYSGLIMRGYIKDVPSAVLSGGQYDPLLKRLGKPGLSGIGFAIYFDELAHYLSEEADNHVDTVLLYAQDVDPAKVMKAIQARIAAGEQVWAGMALPEGLAYKQLVEVKADA